MNFFLQGTRDCYRPDREDVQISDLKGSDLLIYLTRCRTYDIGLASPSTKVEFEHCYFTNTIFAFDEPESLEGFLDSFSTYQQSLLRSFEFNLCNYNSWYITNPSDWLRICNRLPSNLISIEFDLCHWVSPIKESGEKWFIRDWGHCFTRFTLYIDFLNTMGKRARRRAARAKIGLLWCGEDPDYDPVCRAQDRKQWLPVLDELEPWSKGWLDWWEEDTKVDLSEGEGASNKA